MAEGKWIVVRETNDRYDRYDRYVVYGMDATQPTPKHWTVVSAHREMQTALAERERLNEAAKAARRARRSAARAAQQTLFQSQNNQHNNKHEG